MANNNYSWKSRLRKLCLAPALAILFLIGFTMQATTKEPVKPRPYVYRCLYCGKQCLSINEAEQHVRDSKINNPGVQTVPFVKVYKQ
jgi:hypothetical protein